MWATTGVKTVGMCACSVYGGGEGKGEREEEVVDIGETQPTDIEGFVTVVFHTWRMWLVWSPVEYPIHILATSHLSNRKTYCNYSRDYPPVAWLFITSFRVFPFLERNER